MTAGEADVGRFDFKSGQEIMLTYWLSVGKQQLNLFPLISPSRSDQKTSIYLRL